MINKTWSDVDFVKFLGLESNLTLLEIEDLTNSLNREVLYRMAKDKHDLLETTCAVKKEFVLAYLKDIQEQKIIKAVIENLESKEPDFDYCERELASFWASGRKTAPA